MLLENTSHTQFTLPKLTQAEINKMAAGMAVREKRREYQREIERRKHKQSSDFSSNQLSAGNDPRVEKHKQRIAENQHHHLRKKMREKAQDN